jgi:hypothetical protein
MLAHAYVSHKSIGRLRIRIPEKRKDFEYFARIQKSLQDSGASIRVQVTALTGSVLIEHPFDASEITSRAKNLGLFDCDLSGQSKDKGEPVLKEIMRQPWVVKGLLGLGALQLLQGQALAPSSTLFMDALRLWAANQPSSQS